jgi:hypothetical protein
LFKASREVFVFSRANQQLCALVVIAHKLSGRSGNLRLLAILLGRGMETGFASVHGALLIDREDRHGCYRQSTYEGCMLYPRRHIFAPRTVWEEPKRLELKIA